MLQDTAAISQEAVLDTVAAVFSGPDSTPFNARVNQVLKFEGLERQQATEAGPGDIEVLVDEAMSVHQAPELVQHRVHHLGVGGLGERRRGSRTRPTCRRIASSR